MGSELAVAQNDSQVLPSLLTTYDDMEKMAKKLATSSLKELRGNEGDAFIMLMVVRDTGQSLLEVLSNFYLVDGKLAATAQYMLNQVRGAGYRVRFKEEGVPRKDDYRVTCTIVRPDDPDEECTVTWYLSMAKEAGLYDINKKTSAWYKWTRAMLRWRAFTECARFAAPDAMGPVKHTPEELGADVNEEGIPVITTAQPSRTAPAKPLTASQQGAVKAAATSVPPSVTVTQVKTTAPAAAKAPMSVKAAVATPAPARAAAPSAVKTTAAAPAAAASGKRAAQEIFASALKLVKDASRDGKSSDEIKTGLNKIKSEMARCGNEGDTVTVPAFEPGGKEQKRPLRGALAILEKTLA